MTSPNGRHHLVFNGEIYNYRELRRELERGKWEFRTNSDTEVVLAALVLWRTDAFCRFAGMFALAWWDVDQNRLILARDRCGEKPLLYWQDGRELLFASEMKAMITLIPSRPEPDPVAYRAFLHLQYVPEPMTAVRGVRKLPAGTWTAVEPSGGEWELLPCRYWAVDQDPGICPTELGAAGAPVLIRDGLRTAVRRMLHSDVPVGIALSGGLDSSAVAAIAAQESGIRLRAFSVGYPGRPPYDERDAARGLASQIGLDLEEIELDLNAVEDGIPRLLRDLDEPVADIAAFAHAAVPRVAAARGVKVLLSGIGGDEVFWGYPWVSRQVRLNQRSSPSWRRSRWWTTFAGRGIKGLLDRCADSGRVPMSLSAWVSEFSASLDGYTPTDLMSFLGSTRDFRATADALACLGLDAAVAKSADVLLLSAADTCVSDRVPAAIMRMLFDTWLASNCLVLSDRLGMAVGVETRLPLLDGSLIDLVMALRRRIPDHGLKPKAWLRESMSGILPPSVLNRPKRGFQPPVTEWMRQYLRLERDNGQRGIAVAAGLVPAHWRRHVAAAGREHGGSRLLLAYKCAIFDLWWSSVVA